MFFNLLRILLLLLLTGTVSKITLTALNPYQLPLLFSVEGLYSLWWGLRLDLTAAAALATPLVLLLLAGARAGIIKPLLFLAAVWLILTTTGDAIYMLEAGRHVTFEVFTGKGLEQGLLATAFTTYLPQVLAATGLTVAAAFFIWRLALVPSAGRKPAWAYNTALLMAWLVVAATAIRGGWSDAPQSPMSAYKIGDPQQAGLAWNAPYAITYYLSKGEKRAAQQLTPPPSERDLRILARQYDASAEFIAPAKRANVLMVLLESWTAADLYSYAQQVDAAPHFDHLRANSLTTQAMYADGYRTVEGMFATFCSFPNPIGGGVAGTQLQGADYACLPRLLKEQGWDTHFVQGSGKGIVGAFAQTLGFTHSYGKSDYTFEGTENYWGYMDDDIYQFALNKLGSLSAPYLMAINTGTTHDTFLPKESDYVFGKDDRTALRRNVIHHADGALQRFMEALPDVLTEPTLIVLLADHTASIAPEGLQRNAIPFLMLATDGSLPARQLPVQAGQLDIAPTIIDWLGGNVPWFTGQSLLANNYHGFAHYSSGQSVSRIENGRLVRFDVTADDRAECFAIEENGLDLQADNCESTPYSDMLSRARAYTRYTQSLLFAGKTKDFARQLVSK